LQKFKIICVFIFSIIFAVFSAGYFQFDLEAAMLKERISVIILALGLALTLSAPGLAVDFT